MATPFLLAILTPDRPVFEGEVEYVQVPGSEGYLGVLAHHAALVTALAPGTLTYRLPGGCSRTAWGSGEGESAIDLFGTLLGHPLTGVRVAAAAYLLASRTERAVATLRPIARGVGLPALDAEMTLQRYERGELKIK